MRPRKEALRAAFPRTVPIMAGFIFVGLTYGIYMRGAGFSFWYPCLMSLTIFAGSMEFVAVNILLGAFDPWATLALALTVNARHLFYGVAMLDKFKNVGWKKFYLIFGMCDESFAINNGAEIPKSIDTGWYMFFVTLLNHLYWFVGATLGGLLGTLITVDLKGIEFVMTAMFVVIFLDQWLKEDDHLSSVLGVGASLLFLIAVGAEAFLLPAMTAVVAALVALRKLRRRGVRDSKRGEDLRLRQSK